jgi:hypothetical protein
MPLSRYPDLNRFWRWGVECSHALMIARTDPSDPEPQAMFSPPPQQRLAYPLRCVQ